MRVQFLLEMRPKLYYVLKRRNIRFCKIHIYGIDARVFGSILRTKKTRNVTLQANKPFFFSVKETRTKIQSYAKVLSELLNQPIPFKVPYPQSF